MRRYSLTAWLGVLLAVLLVQSAAAPVTAAQHQSAGDWPVWASIGPSQGTVRYVAPNGSDLTGTGAAGSPWRTVQRAVDASAPGDEVRIAAGNYRGAVRIRQPRITLRGTTEGPKPRIIVPTATEAGNEIAVEIDPDADGTRLIGLVIEGGYYYGISCETKWDWGDPNDRGGATKLVIAHNEIRNTGRDAIKLKPNCDDVLIANNHIHHSGVRYDGNAEGIDNVNADRMVVLDNHLHDLATTGIYFKGGATDARVERNLIQRAGTSSDPDGAGAGILVGFDTDVDYFDLKANPAMFEALRGRVMNNIIDGTTASGIGIYAAKDSVVAHNTIINCCSRYHAGLYFGITLQSWMPSGLRPASENVTMWGNLVGVRSDSGSNQGAAIRWMFDDELGAVSGYSGMPTMNYNVYHSAAGAIRFADARPTSPYSGVGLSGWAAHIGGEAQSRQALFTLDADYFPDLAVPVNRQGRYELPLDFYGQARPAVPQAGAVQSSPTAKVDADFVPVAPTRIADTRAGEPVDFPAVKGPLAGGQVLAVPVAGMVGVPVDARAVSLNITLRSGGGDGHVRVYPCGTAPPNSSALNFPSGATTAAGVFAALGSSGRVCVYTSAPGHVIVDVDGWFPSGTSYIGMVPTRVADTRIGQPVGFPAAKKAVHAGQTLHIPIGGVAGIRHDAEAVAMSVAAVNPQQAGHLRVFPCGGTMPNASMLNYPARRTVANAAVMPLGTDAEVCIYSTAKTDLIVDVTGWFPNTSDFVGVKPTRAADTRLGFPVAHPTVKAPLPAGGTLEVPLAGVGQIPPGASALALNVTAVPPGLASGVVARPGHLRIFACGQPIPDASTLNYSGADAVANFAVLAPGSGGSVCIYASAATDVVVDVSGWFAHDPSAP